MTYGDIFLQVLLEAVPERKDEFLKRFEIVKNLPDAGQFNEEVAKEEAEELLNALRQNKEGLIAWIMRGDTDKSSLDS